MNDTIDNLLRDWAARHEPDGDRRRRLEARILRAYRSDHRASPAGPQWIDRGHCLLWFAAGATAAFAAAVLWRGDGTTGDPLAALLAEERSHFADRRPALARIFCETERLFGAKLQWVAQSGRGAELGVSDLPDDAATLAVRLTLVARRDGTREWKRIWEADVVARTDGMLELAPDGNPANRVALWMHRLEGGGALVESRLMLASPVRFSAETSEVLPFGDSRNTARVRCGDTEYLLLQPSHREGVSHARLNRPVCRKAFAGFGVQGSGVPVAQSLQMAPPSLSRALSGTLSTKLATKLTTKFLRPVFRRASGCTMPPNGSNLNVVRCALNVERLVFQLGTPVSVSASASRATPLSRCRRLARAPALARVHSRFRFC